MVQHFCKRREGIRNFAVSILRIELGKIGTDVVEVYMIQ